MTESGSIGSESTYYVDNDGDGYGSTSLSTQSCSEPIGFTDNTDDCADSDDDVNPGATEICDSIDNNCDGVVDEDSASDASTWYIDYDGDGFGSDIYSVHQCAQPSGYVLPWMIVMIFYPMCSVALLQQGGYRCGL